MSERTPLDIANLDHWFGFRLGMTRAQVLEGLKKLGVESHDYSDDNLWATVDDQGFEFYFTEDGSDRLRQFSLESDQILWNGKPLTDERLDDALRAFEPFGRTPMWEANDVIGEAFPEPSDPPAQPVSDEELLSEGTVWLPERGLGLVIYEGEVMGLAWREERDLPTRFAGPVTEAQRQLSKRPDLESYLREKTAAKPTVTVTKSPSSPLHTALAGVCVGLLVFIAHEGFMEMRLWGTAPAVEGTFVSKEDVPRKKHFDLGPEFLRKHMADDPRRYREMYHVEYRDPSGRPQKVALEAAEFYVPPREIGEQVQILYAKGNPPRVKGPSRARDAAFLEYMPWAMAVGVFYVVMQFLIGFVPRISRTVIGLLAAKSARDSDRPELR